MPWSRETPCIFSPTPWRNSPWWARASSLLKLHDLNRTDSSGRVIRSAQRHLPNTQNSRQIPIHPAGFEPAIPASGRSQTHWDRLDSYNMSWNLHEKRQPVIKWECESCYQQHMHTMCQWLLVHRTSRLVRCCKWLRRTVYSKTDFFFCELTTLLI